MALRTFVNQDGTLWNVWNVVPTLVHNDRKVALSIGMTSGWLCFECGGSKRRIVPVPTGWEEWWKDERHPARGPAQWVEPPLPLEDHPAGPVAERTGD